MLAHSRPWQVPRVYVHELLPLTDGCPSGATCLDVKPTYNQGRENGRHDSGGYVQQELRHERILLSGDLPATLLPCWLHSRKILPAYTTPTRRIRRIALTSRESPKPVVRQDNPPKPASCADALPGAPRGDRPRGPCYGPHGPTGVLLRPCSIPAPKAKMKP